MRYQYLTKHDACVCALQASQEYKQEYPKGYEDLADSGEKEQSEFERDMQSLYKPKDVYKEKDVYMEEPTEQKKDHKHWDYKEPR